MPNLPAKKLSEQPVVAVLLPGDRLPVLRRAQDEADATKRNPTATLAALRAALGTDAGPNLRPDGFKSVLYLTVAAATSFNEPNVRTLATLDPATLCLGATCCVVNDPTGHHYYRLVYDLAGPLLVRRDADFKSNDFIQARWVPESDASGAAARAAVRVIVSPDPKAWAINELGRFTLGGIERFFAARIAFAAGTIPLPVAADTVNWREVSPPNDPTRTVLGLSVPEARIYASEPDGLNEGIDYRIFRGAAGDIVLRAVSQDVTNNRPARFAPTGLWQNPVTLAVEVRAYNLTTDTVTLVNPWRFIGDPDLNNIVRGVEGPGIVYGTGQSNNTYGTDHGNNTYGNNHDGNAYGNGHGSNTYGTDHNSNAYGNNHANNTYGTGHNSNAHGNNHANNTYGNNLTGCTFGNSCTFLQVGANCTRVRVFNCNGTAAVPFVIPAGSTDVEYRNNALFVAGGSDALKQDKLLTGYAIGTGAPTAIAATETVLAALGKLEKRAVDNAPAMDYANPVTLTAATTLTATAFGKHHICNATGLALYIIALPAPAGHAGKLLSIRVADTASGMWALQGADINGATERRLWAGETALLECNGTGYRKISGATKPLTAKLRTAAAAFSVTGFLSLQPLPVIVYDTSPGGLMSATANQLTILRPAQYLVISGFFSSQPAQNPQLALLIGRNGNHANSESATMNGTVFQPSGTSFLALNINATVFPAVGDFYVMRFFSQTTTNFNTTTNTADHPFLTLLEVPAW